LNIAEPGHLRPLYKGKALATAAPPAPERQAHREFWFASYWHELTVPHVSVQTGPHVGDWFVVVQYADQTAYEKAQATIAQDPER
jgi:hypothetical protein